MDSNCSHLLLKMDFPGGSMAKNLPASGGDTGSIAGSGSSPGGGHGSPLQCSGLENPVDRGAWWATVRGVTKSRTRLKQPGISTSGRIKWQSHYGKQFGISAKG